MAAMRQNETRPILLLFVLGLMALTANPAAPQNPGSTAPQQSPTPQQSPSPAQNAPQAEENQVEQFRAEAEEGIKHMLVSQIEAWNHGRLEAFMQGYWRSPELTFFSGATVTKGWEPTLERYRQRYKSEGKEMGQLEFQELNIELMNRRTAVVTGHWQLTMSDGKKPNGLFTLIVRRMPGGWKIVHDHTSAE